jgi:ABC-type transport system involved in multi-copper enzyme maturation permease subunit
MRDRILYGLIVFALLLMGLSLALGQLSFAEQERIAINFGTVGVQLSSVILAIFSGSILIAREIEKQTILTLLSKPLSRSEFLLGKFLGLVFVITILVLGFSIILYGIGQMIGASLGIQYLVAVWGILLESTILIAVTMLLGAIVRPSLTVACTIGIFLIGHWVNNLLFFSSKSENEGFRLFGKVISYVVPNLEKFNWRGLVTYHSEIPWESVGSATLNAAGWLLVIMSVTHTLFRRKDFV